jgi:hypothetical protein
MSGGELEEAIREVMCAKPWFLEVNDAQVNCLHYHIVSLIKLVTSCLGALCVLYCLA